MKDDELLHKWINNELSEEEEKSFKLRPEYPSLVELYKHTEDLSTPSFDQEAMLADILKQEKQEQAPVKTSRRRFLSNALVYAAAAVVLLLATWFFWPGNSSVPTIHTLAKGERLEGQLPDGSGFVLNAESTLSYDPNTWKTERSLHLKGEAYFEVKKGETFKVVTPTGSVQVLGTKFNVRSRKQTLEVSCQSGKVAVLSKDGQLLGELNPRNALRVSPDMTTERWTIQATEKASWVFGISKFKKVALSVVLKEVERQFDLRIDDSKVNTTEIVSCNFQHKDLDMALQTTLKPLGIQYEIRNDKLVVLSK